MSAKRNAALRVSGAADDDRYRFLAETLPHIVWTATVDGALDYCNRRWFDYGGVAPGETAQAGFERAVHSDDVAPTLDAWKSAIRNGTAFEVEHRLRRACDGTYRWHSSRALPLRDSDGTIVEWFGSATDIDDAKRVSEAAEVAASQLRRSETEISARKRAEAALRASVELLREVEEHAPIGLALLTLDGNFMRVNPALCTLTGYSRDELLATGYDALIYPEERAAMTAHVATTLDRGVANPEIETRLVRKDGRPVWSAMTLSLVSDEASEATYLIAQIQDITARKAAQHTDQEAQKAALSAVDAKSRFLATMSHELRTPMNGIIGTLELLSLSELSAEQEQFVNVVRESSGSLLRVLDDILDFSKIEAGKLRLESTDFNLPSEVGSVVSLFAPPAHTKGVELRMHIDANVPVTLKGDAGRLRQVLINLVGNALKFTPPRGEVEIVVAVAAGVGTWPTVRFTVADTGVGIAPDARSRLFMPFSQLDASTTRKYGGTGLGLAICKLLVDLMGGQIGLASESGPGSSFWFALPFERSDVDLAASVQPTPSTAVHPAEAGAPETLRPEKLLLAEDNEINALLASKQLQRLGFCITVVPNGRAAVEAVQQRHFDLVFMDCHMPVMDGLDATKRIRALAFQTAGPLPIVAMTANAQVQDREACLAAGMDDYIAKPVTLAQLRTVLDRWLPVKH